MKEEILKALEEQYKIHGNTSGTTYYKIKQETGLLNNELDSLLNELIKEKKVKVQEGLNTSLYYLVK